VQEVNVKGSFLVARSFIAQVPKDTPASVISLTTLTSYQPLPFLSGYMISKLASQQLNSTIAAGYKNITAVNVHPGLQKTQSLQPAFARFDLDSFALVGGTLVWLAADPARSQFLSGRTISINWDVEALIKRKDEIVKDDLLVLDLKGEFGSEQFAGN
jgi:NAD(P)-dependent dehydrogenase (short-subunit alcohol dehydrogenase family)